MYVLGWLPVKVDVGSWLSGVLLFGQDELAGFRDAQNVLLPFMQQDDLAFSLHQVDGPNPPALRPWSPHCWLVRLL
jgi:hypothetical protein